MAGLSQDKARLAALNREPARELFAVLVAPVRRLGVDLSMQGQQLPGADTATSSAQPSLPDGRCPPVPAAPVRWHCAGMVKARLSAGNGKDWVIS